MVPSLSSRLPSLVSYFRCPPPPTLAASHGRRHTSSPVRYPHSRHFNITVIITGSSHCRCDAAGSGTTRNRRHCCCRRRCRWGHRCHWGRCQRSFAHHPCPRRASDSPPSPQPRASTAPIAWRSPPPPHDDDARDHAYPKSGCNDLCVLHEHTFSLMSDWIGTLSSNLQEMVCLQILDWGDSIKKDEKVKEVSTETVLDDLITPLFKALHRHIMWRMLRSKPPRLENKNCSRCCESSLELVASIFVRLYKQEVEPNIKKHSWRIYRKCIEEVFLLTLPNLLLASHGYPTLTEHAAEILMEILSKFGNSTSLVPF